MFISIIQKMSENVRAASAKVLEIPFGPKPAEVTMEGNCYARAGLNKQFSLRKHVIARPWQFDTHVFVCMDKHVGRTNSHGFQGFLVRM